MTGTLTNLLILAGIGQLGVLVASVQVPFRLNWSNELRSLARLHRNLYWVYGGYVVLSIVAFGVITLFNAPELASGTSLARCLCGYVAIFWGTRLALVRVLDVREYLKSGWLKLGYGALLALFVSFTVIYGYAALRPW